MALPHIYRLTTKKDIKNVFTNGKTSKGKFLLFKYLPNTFHHLRCTAVVSKNISPKAVQRNLIRRRIQESITHIYKKFFFNTRYDVVIVALPAILDKEYQEIKTEIDKNITKIFCK